MAFISKPFPSTKDSTKDCTLSDQFRDRDATLHQRIENSSDPGFLRRCRERAHLRRQRQYTGQEVPHVVAPRAAQLLRQQDQTHGMLDDDQISELYREDVKRGRSAVFGEGQTPIRSVLTWLCQTIRGSATKLGRRAPRTGNPFASPANPIAGTQHSSDTEQLSSSSCANDKQTTEDPFGDENAYDADDEDEDPFEDGKSSTIATDFVNSAATSLIDHVATSTGASESFTDSAMPPKHLSHWYRALCLGLISSRIKRQREESSDVEAIAARKRLRASEFVSSLESRVIQEVPGAGPSGVGRRFIWRQ